MTTANAAPRTTITRTADREVRIERAFNAPRDRVWRALTDPALVAQWWGRGNKLVIEKHEPVRGGHWRYVEQTPGGVQGFEGRYRAVKPSEFIERTFEWDGQPGHVVIESVQLEDLGDGRTKLVSTSSFHAVEDLEGMMSSGMEGGLNESYAALDRVLASMA